MSVSTGGIQVVFDPAIDGGAWPGPAARAGEAVVGEAWLGPMGMLGRLETELGLGGEYAAATIRAARLAPILAAREGYWSASLEADGLATARRLLADRDELAMWGWRGEAASARLAALWAVCNEAAPGIPDRLREVARALEKRAVDLESVVLVTPAAELAPLWREVLAALGRRGVRIEERPLRDGAARGDLAAARREAGFAPVGDRSLVLFRPHGVLAAADAVAGMLAARTALDDVVVVTPDGVLDDALTRHGVPRCGGRRAAPGAAALVRLVLEAAFTPMDPNDLHDLVCADPGPVPRRLARELARALGGMPGRGAPAWIDALAEGFAAIEDEQRRVRVAARLQALLDPIASRDGALTLDQVRVRLSTLTTWAAGRLEETPGLASVLGAAEALTSLIDGLGAPTLTRGTLRRLCDVVDRGRVGGVGEAGLAHVAAPGAVLGGVGTIVWWSFTRAAAPRSRRLRLSLEEREALRAAGLEPPDAGAAMASEARRWRRPLTQSTEALVLVCPQTDVDGEPAHPHPLWDELGGAMTDERLAVALVDERLVAPLALRTSLVALRPRPVPFERARAGRSLTPRPIESPSSLEKLLGCSLQWALHYHGWVRSGFGSGPGTPGPLLYGTLAHHFLDRIFEAGARSADEAAREAAVLLERDLHGLSEGLALPDHQVERAELKRAVVETARRVGELVAMTGATIAGTELEVGRDLGPVHLRGTIDLLLAGPDIIVDYKWGQTTYRSLLEAGAALQLAAYAEIRRDGASRPQIAYLILKNQRLLAEPGTPLPDVHVRGRTSAEATWAGARRALDARLAELANGHLHAPAASGGDPAESELTGDLLAVGPSCKYCEHQVLCGRRGGR